MRFLSAQAIIIFITVFINAVQGQNLKGVVKSDDGDPILGVSVWHQNQIVSQTDAQGTFFLPRQIKLPIILFFEHENFQAKKHLFSNNNQHIYLKEIEDVQQLDPIVVQATTEISSRLILPVAKINAEHLEHQSPVAVIEAINKIPGVFIQSGAINTNRITIRGVGSRTLYGTDKIKAYFNDLPITNGVGETTLDIFDAEDLEYIEIIKGPKATLYGTNLGGTILMTSKKPKELGFSLQNNTTVGSFGLYKNSMSTGYATEDFNIHLNYNHLELDGFRENSTYRINSYVLNSTYRLNAKAELSFLFNHSNYFAQLPSSIGKTAYDQNPAQAASTWLKAKGYKIDRQLLAGLNLKYQFSTHFKNSTSVFYSQSDHYEPRPFNILDEASHGLGLRSVFNHSIDFLGRKALWNFGTELYQDTYEWKTIENLYADNNGQGSLEGKALSSNRENRNNMNFFTDITLPIYKKWQLQFGVNYNKTVYDTQDIFTLEEGQSKVSRKFDPIIAPNLNLTYQLSPQINLFGNVSYGFNYPSLQETLTPDGIINAEISPEKGYNYEFGSEAYFLNRNLHILTTYYILDISDLLVAQRVGDDQYIGRNAGRTLHRGFELSSNYKIQLSDFMALAPYFNASYNWHQFKDFISGDHDFSGNELTGVPDLTIASGISVKFFDFSLFINHLHVGAMPMNDFNNLYSDSYNILNVKLEFKKQLLNALDLKVNFGINNVADTKYASSILINATSFNTIEPRYYYPGNPRNYFGGIQLRYIL